MKREPANLHETPSQTAGPFVHIGLAPKAAGLEGGGKELGQDIAGPNAKGDRITIRGRVLDSTGSPIKDAMLEVWQANSTGIYAHPEQAGAVEEGFRGWGRTMTDFETGVWQLATVKPGPVPVAGRDGARMAPHMLVWIVARGINIGLHTRLYFGDEEAANADDPVLGKIEWSKRRATLIAARDTQASDPIYTFDIVIGGPDETVFFDI